MTEFDVGSVVRLRSGSPALTVVHANPYPLTEANQLVRVSWFYDGKVHTADLPVQTLERSANGRNGNPGSAP